MFAVLLLLLFFCLHGSTSNPSVNMHVRLDYALFIRKPNPKTEPRASNAKRYPYHWQLHLWAHFSNPPSFVWTTDPKTSQLQPSNPHPNCSSPQNKIRCRNEYAEWTIVQYWAPNLNYRVQAVHYCTQHFSGLSVQQLGQLPFPRCLRPCKQTSLFQKKIDLTKVWSKLKSE